MNGLIQAREEPAIPQEFYTRLPMVKKLKSKVPKYFGNSRGGLNPSVGPFENPGKGLVRLKVW